MTTDASILTQFGRSGGIAASPEEAVLERVPNPYADTNYKEVRPAIADMAAAAHTLRDTTTVPLGTVG